MSALANFVISRMLRFEVTSGLIGLAWLIWLGDWAPILIGAVFLVVGATFLGVLFATIFPIVSRQLIRFVESENRLGLAAVATFNLLLTYLIFSFWCIGISYLMLANSSMEGAIPTLLLAYNAATIPIGELARRELSTSQTDSAVYPAFFVKAAFVLAANFLVSLGTTIGVALVAFFIVVGIGLAVSFHNARLHGLF